MLCIIFQFPVHVVKFCFLCFCKMLLKNYHVIIRSCAMQKSVSVHMKPKNTAAGVKLILIPCARPSDSTQWRRSTLSRLQVNRQRTALLPFPGTTSDETSTRGIGKLKNIAIVLFQLAHGLNGRTRLDHAYIISIITKTLTCSEKAVWVLFYGSSYQQELAQDRLKVHGYKPYVALNGNFSALPFFSQL